MRDSVQSGQLKAMCIGSLHKEQKEEFHRSSSHFRYTSHTVIKAISAAIFAISVNWLDNPVTSDYWTITMKTKWKFHPFKQNLKKIKKLTTEHSIVMSLNAFPSEWDKTAAG